MVVDFPLPSDETSTQGFPGSMPATAVATPWLPLNSFQIKMPKIVAGRSTRGPFPYPRLPHPPFKIPKQSTTNLIERAKMSSGNRRWRLFLKIGVRNHTRLELQLSFVHSLSLKGVNWEMKSMIWRTVLLKRSSKFWSKSPQAGRGVSIATFSLFLNQPRI